MDSMSQFIEMFGDCVNRIKLSSLCSTFVDGDWIESKDQSELGIRLIQTGNVGNGFFKDKEDKSRYISEETFDNLHCTEIYPGDILVSRLPDPIGRACIIPQGLGRTITAVDCTIIRLKDIILPDYFIAYTMTPSYVAQINEVTTGTTRRRVSRANLGNILIPCPSIAKQQQFVAIAKQADKSKFGDFKSQFIEMFSKYPSETPWHKLLTIINGKAYPEEYNNIGTYPICGSAGIMYYGERKLCDANTIILGRKGNINHPIYMESDYWIVDTAFCLDVNKSILLPKYFYYWCCQYDFTKLNKQGVLPSLTRKDLEKIEMSVPPMAEQKKFVSIVEQADKSKSYVRIAFKNLESMLGYCIRQIS